MTIARLDVPALLAEVESLRIQRDGLASVVAKIARYRDSDRLGNPMTPEDLDDILSSAPTKQTDREEARRDLEWGMKKWRATVEEERSARLDAERRLKEAGL